MSDVQQEREPLGQPLPPVTDDDLADLMIGAPHEVEAAAQWWRTHAPKEFKGLLDSDSEGALDAESGS